MLTYRSFIVFILFFYGMSINTWADESVMPPPEDHDSKVLIKNDVRHHEIVETEPVDLKKELVPNNIGKDVQIRSYIRKTDKAKVSEYSLHGRVYMVKIQPVGDTLAYYLYDEDGDGNFSKRLPANYKRLNPPVWVLKKF